MFSKNIAEKARRAVVLAIVVGLVAQSAVAPAMAAGSSTTTAATSPECESTGADRGYGDLLTDFVTPDETAKIGSKLLGNGEDTDCYSGDQVGNLTQSGTFISAAAGGDQANLTATMLENHLKDMRPYVRSQVKATIVREWQNESNASAIKTAVNQTVDDEYARVRLNAANSWESVSFHIYALATQNNQTGVGGVLSSSEGTHHHQLVSTIYDYEIKMVDVQVALGNGTTANVSMYRARGNMVFNPFDKSGNSYSGDPNAEPGPDKIRFVHPDYGSEPSSVNSTSTNVAADLERVFLADEMINTEKQRVKDNAAQLVDNLTAEYNYSELNITEILSAGDLAATWSTNLNSTGYYGWAAAELSTLGINGSTAQSFAIAYEPEYDDQTGTFEPNKSTYNGSTLNMSGTMFTDWKPAKTNGSFVAGETYEIPEDKTVIFAWQKTSNQSVRVRLDGNVTIRSLTDVQTGEEINETSLESEYRATFETQFNESWLEDSLEYKQQVIDDAEAGSTGGGGGFDFGSVGPFGAGALGLVAIGGLFVAGKILGN